MLAFLKSLPHCRYLGRLRHKRPSRVCELIQYYFSTERGVYATAGTTHSLPLPSLA